MGLIVALSVASVIVWSQWAPWKGSPRTFVAFFLLVLLTPAWIAMTSESPALKAGLDFSIVATAAMTVLLDLRTSDSALLCFGRASQRVSEDGTISSSRTRPTIIKWLFLTFLVFCSARLYWYGF